MKFYSMFNAGRKNEFTPGWMLGEKINLIWAGCWKQGWIYSEFKEGSKDEILLQVECAEQRWIYSGLNAGSKDNFTLV